MPPMQQSSPCLTHATVIGIRDLFRRASNPRTTLSFKSSLASLSVTVLASAIPYPIFSLPCLLASQLALPSLLSLLLSKRVAHPPFAAPWCCFVQEAVGILLPTQYVVSFSPWVSLPFSLRNTWFLSVLGCPCHSHYAIRGSFLSLGVLAILPTRYVVPFCPRVFSLVPLMLSVLS